MTESERTQIRERAELQLADEDDLDVAFWAYDVLALDAALTEAEEEISIELSARRAVPRARAYASSSGPLVESLERMSHRAEDAESALSEAEAKFRLNVETMVEPALLARAESAEAALAVAVRERDLWSDKVMVEHRRAEDAESRVAALEAALGEMPMPSDHDAGVWWDFWEKSRALLAVSSSAERSEAS